MYALVLVLILLFPLGLALLVLGVRGRRIDDHPICRRCGFDLFGLPGGSDRCSECGAEVNRRRAIRIGRRKRRVWLIAGGAVLLALALAGGGGAGYAASKVTDWQPHKPVWWLVREMKGTDAPTRDAAIAEASKRLANGKLSDRQVRAVADHALAVQADLKKTWLAPLGDFIEAARTANRLSDDRWQRYAAQSIAFELTARPRVRRGDPIPYAVRRTASRTASRTRLRFEHRSIERFLDDVALGQQEQGVGAPQTPVGDWASAIEMREYKDKLFLGAHQLRLEARLDALELVAGRAVHVGTVPVDMSADFELLHPAQPTVNSIYDGSLRQAVGSAFHFTGAHYIASADGQRQLVLDIHAYSPPVGIGYEVLLLTSQGWARVGDICCPGGTPQRQWQIRCAAAGIASAAVLRLEPSEEAAARSVDTFEVWRGALRLQRPLTESELQLDALLKAQAEFKHRRAATQPRRSTAPD